MGHFINSLGSYLTKSRPIKLIWAIVILQFLLHIPFFNAPPISQHTWRQVISLATAKNYFEEDARLLYPKSDTRVSQNDPGLNYQEFPLIYWVVGMSYKLTGFNHANSRVFAFVLASLLLFISYFLLIELGIKKNLALSTIFFMSVSPLYFYYSINLLPNIPALLFFMSGLWFYLKSLRSESFSLKYDLPGILLFSLAMVTKATWLFYGLLLAGIGIYYIKATNKPGKTIVKLAVWASMILLMVAAQYYHQFSLHQANPHERQSIVTLEPAFILSWNHFLAIIKPALSHWFVELTVGYAALLFFLAGMVQVVKKYRKPISFTGLFWSLWVCSAAAFTAMFLPLYEYHAYYQTHILLPTAFISALGLQTVLKSSRWRQIAIILLVLAPINAGGRIMPRWILQKQIPEALLTNINEFQQAIPKDELVLVIGDRTPNVYLYYLERKGMAQMDFSPQDKESFEQGERKMKWIVHRRDIKTQVELSSVFKFAKQIGEFDLYYY